MIDSTMPPGRLALAAARAVVGREPGGASLVPPPRRHPDSCNIDQVAASLAGGMMAASGKPHTPAEAVAVWWDVRQEVRRAMVDGPPGGG